MSRKRNPSSDRCAAGRNGNERARNILNYILVKKVFIRNIEKERPDLYGYGIGKRSEWSKNLENRRPLW